MNMTDNDKEELIYTAVTECRERSDQQTSVDDDDVAAVNYSSVGLVPNTSKPTLRNRYSRQQSKPLSQSLRLQTSR